MHWLSGRKGCQRNIKLLMIPKVALHSRGQDLFPEVADFQACGDDLAQKFVVEALTFLLGVSTRISPCLLRKHIRDWVKVRVDLLADEFKILLGIGHAHYAGIVVNPEEERSAVRIGKSAHALEPAANLLPLKLYLEIISRTLDNEYVVFYSHKLSFASLSFLQGQR